MSFIDVIDGRTGPTYRPHGNRVFLFAFPRTSASTDACPAVAGAAIRAPPQSGGHCRNAREHPHLRHMLLLGSAPLEARFRGPIASAAAIVRPAP